MSQYFNNLTTVNIELTSRCNKNCWMCGRRKVDRDYPEIALDYGDMDFELIESIAQQLPDNIVIQFHDNGEPLMYPRFGEAIKLFNRQICCTNTNGMLLIEKADEIIDTLDTLTISTFENDEDSETQYPLIEEFLKLKGDRKPNVIIRCLGDVDQDRYKKFNCIIATRILHNPMGSFKFKRKPTIPEIGICLDLLNHMVIAKDGKVSMCVRFDPEGHAILGDATTTPLLNIWNGQERQRRIAEHIKGNRNSIPLCDKCEFWGVPTGTGK